MNRCEYKFGQSFERGLALVVLAGTALFAAGVSLGASSIHAMGMQAAGGQATVTLHDEQAAKHGGIFLTAANHAHAIEGALLTDGTFGVYLYDKATQPLSADKLKQARATVQWGNAVGASRTPLALSKDGQRLEAVPAAGDAVALPITLIVRIVFPGSSPNATPELFRFPFSHHIGEDARAQQPPVSSSDHSGRTNAPAPPGEHSMDTLEHRPGR